MARRCSGRSFHALGAATLKARSPNFRRVLGTCRSDFVADRKTVWRSGSAETDWRRFDMYNGALPVLFMAKWTNKHSLYWIRASIGNQCSSMAAAVTWSRERSPYTSLTAALMTRCSGAISWVRQSGEQNISVVKSWQHECADEIGGDVTTEQTSDLPQTSQVKEACLRRLWDVRLHAKLTV